MSYQPIIPPGGLIGWSYLSRTLETQASNFEKNSEIVRDTEYFEQNIKSVQTAEALVSDRRLLRVALGAFGLQSDIDSRAFIQKVLEGGTEKPETLANRLSDERYAEFAKAFGFGNADGPSTGKESWAQGIIAKFQRQQFEIAVGNQDESMRLAMDAQRTMPEIGALTGSEETRWFKIMANPPLRQVFETALGLPASFGQADLDIQANEFADRAQRQLGINDLSSLSDPDVQDAIIQRFFLRDQIASFSLQSSGAIALSLLQSMPRLY
jgi:hypothetical protein